MFTSVQGRSVIVTGGSKGIGLGIASVFAEAGARVMLAGRDAASLEDAAASLAAAPGEVRWTVTDVADPAACAALAAATVDRFGGIDVLCANAGIFPSARLDTMSPAELGEMLDVNVKGTVYCVQACLDALTASGRGRVVVTSSITGPITGYPGWSHYGASKAAQLGFIRTAAMELAPRHITINAVLPGNIVTEGLLDLGEEYRDAMAAAIPLGALGHVRDIGHAALFFASDEAGYVTGQSLVVDGGQVLPESAEAIADMTG